MASKSRFALVLVSTRKAMLYAQLFKRLVGRLSATGFHVLITLPDACNCFLEVLMFPSQVFGEGIIERGHGILAAALRIRLQLGLAFRFYGYYIHDAFRIVVAGTSVNDVATCQGVSRPACADRLMLALTSGPVRTSTQFIRANDGAPTAAGCLTDLGKITVGRSPERRQKRVWRPAAGVDACPTSHPTPD
jgi:hypothetical protein